jgi:hypothetical protein
MKQLTDQEWLDRGVRAEELLSNQVFAQVVQDVIDYQLSAFLNSKPEDDKLRELAYHQATAMQQVIGVLQQWVAVKESIKQNLNSVEE